MAKKFRKIGILTSGGDAPGMNACVKAVVNKACSMGIEVVGIIGGYAGLINGNVEPLTHRTVSGVVGRGGTVLYSSRCPEFKTPEGMAKAVETCRLHEIDALICIGGDGTFRGATDMTEHGIPSIGLPGTIDNDITATDYTIGFDTAVNTTVTVIDQIRDTCESHARCNVVEVMGRYCGQIALYSAIASGAVAVAIAEMPFDEAATLEKIRKLRAAGKRGMVVVVAEGVVTEDGKPYSEVLKEKINRETGVESKFMRLAHSVRGGNPKMKDRTIASEMGVRAVELLVEGKSNLVVCELDGEIVPVDIAWALIADRMYKGTLQEGDLERFSEEERKAMEEIVEKRRREIERLYKIAHDVSF